MYGGGLCRRLRINGAVGLHTPSASSSRKRALAMCLQRGRVSQGTLHTIQDSTLAFANSVDSDHDQWNNVCMKHAKFMHVSTDDMALRNKN